VFCALKAWPLPLLLHINSDRDACIRLAVFQHALGLPAEAADWNNTTTLEFFRVQQHKVVAFCSGRHARLGAASVVSRLNDQVCVYVCVCVLCVCVYVCMFVCVTRSLQRLTLMLTILKLAQIYLTHGCAYAGPRK